MQENKKQKEIVDNFGKEFLNSLKTENNLTSLKPDTSFKVGFVIKEQRLKEREDSDPPASASGNQK